MRPWLWSRIDLDKSPRLQPLLDLIVETGTFVSPTVGIFEARRGEKEASEEQVRGFATMMQFITRCHRNSGASAASAASELFRSARPAWLGRFFPGALASATKAAFGDRFPSLVSLFQLS